MIGNAGAGVRSRLSGEIRRELETIADAFVSVQSDADLVLAAMARVALAGRLMMPDGTGFPDVSILLAAAGNLESNLERMAEAADCVAAAVDCLLSSVPEGNDGGSAGSCRYLSEIVVGSLAA